jgi:hypothetical protein
MPHKPKGGYSAKYPQGTTVSEELRRVVAEKSTAGTITCAAAHKISRDLNIPPSEVGKAIDLMEYHLHKCQLGLFGYKPEKKIAQPPATVSSELRDHIAAHLENGRLSCAAAWRSADTHAMSRLEFGGVCEALKLKISPCQLGAF